MKSIVVTENPDKWSLDLPGISVVSARAYLTNPEYASTRGTTVFNLCRNYGYQRLGYYVSLLAAARGHRALPSVDTIRAIRVPTVSRILSEEFDSLIQRTLAPLKSDRFELSIYFGRNMAKRYDRLAKQLFNQFPAPFLRATFVRSDRWKLQGVSPIAATEIPDTHGPFVTESATEFFEKPLRGARAKRTYRYNMAILWDENEVDGPSDERAIRKFERASRLMGMDATVINLDDYGRIAEFDALFIRMTTSVPHMTYRIAQRAQVEGLVVIDDPGAIVRCSNKVYQTELFARFKVPSPKTFVVHRGNIDEVQSAVGLPCVLKRPDGAFSTGVVRVDSVETLKAKVEDFLDDSELVLAQAFVPSTFDWRIGVLGGRPLYAAQYHMARGHWQIVSRDRGRDDRYGKVDAFDLDKVPADVVAIATKAASLMGNGLFGVDVKETTAGSIVLEVNDNPTIQSGCEDTFLKDELYIAIMRWFRDQLDTRGGAVSGDG